MTILLLGGNGLLGHNVLNHLLQQGHAVHALLRNPAALYYHNFPNTHLLQVFEGSLLSDPDLERAAQGCDAIINCAGVTDMSLLHLEDYYPVNRDLCARLLTLMDRLSITRLVHTSTANTIGYGSLDRLADESAQIQPPFSRSYYAISKREGEQILEQAALRHPDYHIIIVNPGFMVGAYDTKPSSGTLLLAAYRKPLMVAPRGGKSFLAAADAAVAIVNAISRGRSGQRYLLTGKNLSLSEFYKALKFTCGYRQLLFPLPDWLLSCAGRVGDLLRAMGVQTQLSTRNVRQLMVREYYSNSLAKDELEMPETPVAQFIAQFIGWYNSR